jgi:hypothetical protein
VCKLDLEALAAKRPFFQWSANYCYASAISFHMLIAL